MTEPAALYVWRPTLERLLVLPARPWEVGGWLLGYWSAGRSAVFVTHATPPARRGTPWGVWISGRGHTRRFEEAWEASGGIVTFVGDWHTHPGGPGLPSRRDERAARQLATDPAYGTPEPVIAIVTLPRVRGTRTARAVSWYLGSADRSLTPVTAEIASSLPARAAGVPTWV